MGKSIVIIGGGIAGLAVGCYAQMNGYKTQVFEMGDKPGGLCTAWERKGYTIDGCLHWLCGSSPEISLYRYWEELGMIQGKKIVDMEQFCRIEGPEGKVFTIYTDIDRLEKHMKELAPEDSAFIMEFATALRHFTKFNMSSDKAPELCNIFDGIKMFAKMIPHMSDFKKWGGMTLKEFAEHFQNPFLRNAWEVMMYPEMSIMGIFFTLAWLHLKTAGYVIGGSMELSRGIEKRYQDLGGTIRYKSEVTEILVENDIAAGIRLSDGTENRADYVVSAADGYTTIFNMLGERYIDARIKGYYETLPIFQPLVYIALGINRSFEDMPQIVSGMMFPLEEPITIAGKKEEWLNAHIYNFDPTLAPKGKTVVMVMYQTTYRYWESLRENMSDYKAEKERICNDVIAALDQRFPGLASQVEMRDVATPATFNRYTGNWQGSFEGWLITPDTSRLNMKKTLPGLSNFYMAGQWVQPGGGLPGAVISGCYAAQLICKNDKKKFITAVP
jgi:phytoene dehydrogenase-like protein